MILVDTSVWVDHFREGVPRLADLLMDAQVVIHPFVIGELACGNLKNRVEILSLLQALPMIPVVELQEFLYFVDSNNLMGRGIGFVDVNLLASAQLAGVPLWTRDKRLKSVAVGLGLSASS